MAGAWYVNKSTGALARVTDVNDRWARYEVVAPKPSNASIPVEEYDRDFLRYWRPATGEDLERLELPSGYRPPANAPVEIRETSTATID